MNHQNPCLLYIDDAAAESPKIGSVSFYSRLQCLAVEPLLGIAL